MSRMFMTWLFTLIITRLLYWISGFNPFRDLKPLLGYPIDLGIWIVVGLFVYRALGIMGMGKKAGS